MSLILLNSDAGGAAGAELASSAVGRGSVQASLTTGIPFASIAQAAVIVAASLTTALALSVSITGNTSLQANLTTAIPLTATLSAHALLQSDLSIAASPPVVATHNTVLVFRNKPRAEITPHSTRVQMANRYNLVRFSNG